MNPTMEQAYTYFKTPALLVYFYLLVVGLFFTATNKVYLSAAPSLFALILFVPLLIGKQKTRLHSVTFFALLFYLVSIANVLIYHPSSLLEFAFYRYDGNFMISYAPFLLLPFLCYTLNLEKLLLIFLFTVLAVNIPAFVLHLQQGSPYYTTLFTSTNAGGGFYAVMSALVIGLLSNRIRLVYVIALICMLVFLFATTSRGSILGLMAGMLAWIFWKKRIKYATGLMLVAVIVVQIVFIESFYGYYLDGMNLEDYQQMTDGSYMNTKLSNIYIRLLHEWPAGVDAFMRSPVVGYGFGSISDLPYTNSNLVPGLIEHNNSGNIVYSAAHAHHSYLHILGEQGIVGLIVVLLMWVAIYRKLVNSHAIPWLRDGLIISFWTIIFASFTEHRLTTPAMILPFAILFVLYQGWQCNKFMIEERNRQV